MDVFEKRRAYLRALIDDRFGESQTKLADVLDVQSNLISRYLLPPTAANHKNIGERAARSMERKLGLQPGAMDGGAAAATAATRELHVREDRATYFGVPNSKEEAELGREWGKIEDADVREELKTMIFLLVAKQKQAGRGKAATSSKKTEGTQVRVPAG